MPFQNLFFGTAFLFIRHNKRKDFSTEHTESIYSIAKNKRFYRKGRRDTQRRYILFVMKKIFTAKFAKNAKDAKRA